MRTIVSASVGQGAGAPGLAGTQDQASQAPALGPMIEIQDPRSAQDPTCRPASLPWAAFANKRLTLLGNRLVRRPSEPRSKSSGFPS